MSSQGKDEGKALATKLVQGQLDLADAREIMPARVALEVFRSYVCGIFMFVTEPVGAYLITRISLCESVESIICWP